MDIKYPINTERNQCMSEITRLNVAEIFGENVFDDAAMQARLPKKIYQKLHQCV